MNEPRRDTRFIDEILAAARTRLDRVQPAALESERTAGAAMRCDLPHAQPFHDERACGQRHPALQAAR